VDVAINKSKTKCLQIMLKQKQINQFL